ncbi:hypothetical protein SAMN04488025_11129 [Planifilum fulgidum]|uniref:TIGR01777 family protein n=1 Tax=Planifilum fulgidum TaxID=201973 RepID=A0A1I2N5I7_9BACL|nr:TIGR01777 family oxidoreductase [Planifilum fulgidum]SFF98370.1 hypothetical protein SAMN04488025_11129 [Planifilum fulgidum]
MRIVITGSTGLVGTRLAEFFQEEGRQVLRLVRKSGRGEPGTAYWQPETGEIDAEALEGADVLIHLAGKSINGRWTKRRKEEILLSRTRGTRLIAETLAALKRPPGVFLCASGIGTTREGGREVDEKDSAGSGFLSGVIKEWEKATVPAKEAGIRVVNMRFGMVLSPRGGALKRMLPAYKLGLGGRLGHGRQWMSWVALEEIPHVVRFLIERDEVAGPVNVVSPNPVSNAEFIRALGGALRRPVAFPVPAFAVKLMFGEMGEELLLWGNRAIPKKLLEVGYSFRYPDLEKALREMLG